jgi:hypothetical protein
MPVSRKTILVVELLAAAICLALCWTAVSWATQPGLFMMLDEISNLPRYLNGVTWTGITILPHYAYNDRPVGFVLERWMFDIFGFDYRPQLIAMLSIHFANLLLAFVIFRRLGLSVLLSVTGLCVFGTLATTAQTVTYIGANFDVLCLFFMLASIVAFLSTKHWAAPFSAVLFFLALRSKEFAIVLPVLLLGIVYCETPIPRAMQVVKRLWMHLAIWAAFLYQYAVLIHHMIPVTSAGNPYKIRADLKTVLTSLWYYIPLIFHAEATRTKIMILMVTLSMVGYAVFRRHRWALWAFAGFLLTILPVSIIPGNRSSFYVYAPQLFLLLGAVLVADDVLRLSTKSDRNQWFASIATVAVVLTSVISFQRSDYFRNQVIWTLGVRRVSATTAADAFKLLPGITPDSWLFIYSAKDTPWLLFPGPCDFLNILQHRPAFNCVLGSSSGQIRAQFEAHQGPKYYMTYGTDGSLRMPDEMSALARQPAQSTDPAQGSGILAHAVVLNAP